MKLFLRSHSLPCTLAKLEAAYEKKMEVVDAGHEEEDGSAESALFTMVGRIYEF